MASRGGPEGAVSIRPGLTLLSSTSGGGLDCCIGLANLHPGWKSMMKSKPWLCGLPATPSLLGITPGEGCPELWSPSVFVPP